MDDRIIDFNQIKNKAREKDVDKLEDYMYSLYYQMAEGKITMSDFTQSIYKYMEDNNISQDKFLNMQKKLMERYGFEPSNIEEQLKTAGLKISGVDADYESIRRTMSFQEKYKDRLSSENINKYYIKNDKNNVEIMLLDQNVILISEGKVDLNDNELNEFLVSYKKLREDKTLSIKVCENTSRYDY